ncbi:hypothetical protein [Streptosporangium vulgare]|uniref:hypothetical protein n=1 Tax=Streptosporangium vulgare TaxID=46190 RepID=UPI0031CE2256
MVGEVAVLDGSTRSADVVACGVTVVQLIKGEVFLGYLRRHPSAALSTLMGDRLRWANQRRLEFAGYDSDICLGHLLPAVLARHGRTGGHGSGRPADPGRARRPDRRQGEYRPEDPA